MHLPSNLSILVVDDDPIMMTLTTSLLLYLGYENVTQVSDGITALEMMRRTAFGLVICDWNMEPITGCEVLRQMRADPELNHTPFILASTQANLRNATAEDSAGVNGYLVKPFGAVALQQAITAAC